MLKLETYWSSPLAPSVDAGCDRALGRKGKGDSSYLRIHPINLKEVRPVDSTARVVPSSHHLQNTWLAPTDRGSVVEESETEDEEEEGRM